MDDKDLTATIKNDIPLNFWKTFTDFKDDVETASRMDEEVMVSANGSSVVVKKDGRINMAAGHNAEKKISASGNFSEISQSNTIKTNRRKIETDDLILNNHKLNNKIYEFSDYKKILDNDTALRNGIVGGLTMFGTVLTKSWDNNLGRYVLIRRLVNMPIFSPSLGVPEVHPGLKINPSMDKINEYQSIFNNGQENLADYAKRLRKKEEEISKELEKESEKSNEGVVEKYGEEESAKN